MMWLVPAKHLRRQTQRCATTSVLRPVSARQVSTSLLLLILFTATGLAQSVDKEETAEKTKKRSLEKVVKLFDGKTLKGWKTVEVFDFKRHGKVEVKDGAVLLTEGDPMTGIAYKGKPPRMNYELTVEGRRVSGDDFFCGITFPVADTYCSLILGGWGGTVTGLSNVDGYNASENETSGFHEYDKGKWYTIRLRVTEKVIQAWIDKDQVVDLKTPDHEYEIWWEQEPLRPLGFASWHTTGALRKIEIRRLKLK